MTRYLDFVPHPWSRETIEAAIFKNFLDAKNAIEDTPGGKLWRSLRDLEDAVWILEVSTIELLDEICLFADRSKNPKFWHEVNAREAKYHTLAVKRKLFNCTSSLMALVDHARNFQSATPVSGYYERIKAIFSPSGLHDFLQCLRNYNTHWRVAQAHWSIRHDLRLNLRVARFAVAKSELLLWNGWTKKAKEYISGVEDFVDIYDVFSTYIGLTQQAPSAPPGCAARLLDSWTASRV